MDSLTKIITDIASWHWWFTVVLVGLLINLASSYLKPSIDRLYERVSSAQRYKKETQRLELKRKAEELAQNPTLTLLEGIAELRERLFSLLAFLMGFVFAGLAIMVVKFPSDEKASTFFAALFVIMGISNHVVAIAVLKRATRRSEIMLLAKGKLQSANATN